jgi:hypothetical protein
VDGEFVAALLVLNLPDAEPGASALRSPLASAVTAATGDSAAASPVAAALIASGVLLSRTTVVPTAELLMLGARVSARRAALIATFGLGAWTFGVPPAGARVPALLSRNCLAIDVALALASTSPVWSLAAVSAT